MDSAQLDKLQTDVMVARNAYHALKTAFETTRDTIINLDTEVTAAMRDAITAADVAAANELLALRQFTAMAREALESLWYVRKGGH